MKRLHPFAVFHDDIKFCDSVIKNGLVAAHRNVDELCTCSNPCLIKAELQLAI